MNFVSQLFFVLVSMSLSLTSQALINSTETEEPAFQANVFISTIALADDGDEVNGYCNATFLSNQILVTAAHCVAESLALAKDKIHIEVGSYKYISRKTDGKVVRIGYNATFKKDVTARFVLSKNLQKKLMSSGPSAHIPPGEDVAIVVLKEKFELEPTFNFASVVPQKIWEEVKSNLSAASFYIVSINYIDTTTMDYKRVGQLNKFTLSFGGWIDSQSSVRVSEGDSGSPVFIKFQDHYYMAAVVKGLASNIFSNWDVMATLSQKACDVARENSLALDVTNLICR